MAVINVAAFATANLLGRSTFRAPLIVDAHALVFFEWVATYVTQNALAASGSLRLHRKLGWVAAGWMALMVVLGIVATVRLVRLGHALFFQSLTRRGCGASGPWRSPRFPSRL